MINPELRNKSILSFHEFLIQIFKGLIFRNNAWLGWLADFKIMRGRISSILEIFPTPID